MARYMYERLSAQDNSFLVAESAKQPLHVASVNLFEIGELATPDGGVNIRRIRQATEAELYRIPRYRQVLMWVPLENRPVWVDDPHFSIDYHIRHSSLPRPGGVEELKKLTARITSRVLDRARPLWEVWVVEGLSENRFAIVTKIHHCMIDGMAGAELAQILYSLSPAYEISEPRDFIPRPAPSGSELLADAMSHYAGLPAQAARSIGSLVREPTDTAAKVGNLLKSAASIASMATPSSDTPLNGPLGPNRRVDWLTLPLDDVKTVRNRLSCSVNDVVLATVTGAIRQYLIRRRVNPADIDFRVSAPVSMRRPDERGQLGNRVSAWIVPLPIAHENPLNWVREINTTTQALKESNQAAALDFLMQAAEFAPPSILALASRMASGPMNMIVTNIMGPPFPLYLLGARLLELQPLVPLLDGTGLGIALFSYDGKLHVGFNADYERVPDLGTVTALFAQAFMALADAATVQAQTQPSTKPSPKKRRRKEHDQKSSTKKGSTKKSSTKKSSTKSSSTKNTPTKKRPVKTSSASSASISAKAQRGVHTTRARSTKKNASGAPRRSTP